MLSTKLLCGSRKLFDELLTFGTKTGLNSFIVSKCLEVNNNETTGILVFNKDIR